MLRSLLNFRTSFEDFDAIITSIIPHLKIFAYSTLSLKRPHRAQEFSRAELFIIISDEKYICKKIFRLF